MLTIAEIDEVEQQVGNDIKQEHHDQQQDSDTEEQQITPDTNTPVVPGTAETHEATAIDIDLI